MPGGEPTEGRKVRENRSRRAAARQRIGLSKVRRFDRLAADYGLWQIDDPRRGRHLTDLTLDQVEHYLQTSPGE